MWTMAWTGKLRVDVDVCGYGRGGVYRRVAWMSKQRVNVNGRYICGWEWTCVYCKDMDACVERLSPR